MPTFASDLTRIGYGRLLTNDVFGDGRDRWQTGSYAISYVWAKTWDGQTPQRFGDLLELRLGGAIMAPQWLTNPPPSDRPFVGAVSFGLHSHAILHQYEFSAGADLVFTGPSTGLGSFQRELHELLNVNPSSEAVLAAQIPDGLHVSVVLEAGRPFALGSAIEVRPFVEVRAGVETMLRAGFDLRLGAVGRREFWVRDTTSGHRYRVIQRSDPGYSFVIGGDIARVTDSLYLPEERGIVLNDTRKRLRAGLHWQGKQASAFYGLTWLGEEFAGQGGGQVVGSIRINLPF